MCVAHFFSDTPASRKSHLDQRHSSSGSFKADTKKAQRCYLLHLIFLAVLLDSDLKETLPTEMCNMKHMNNSEQLHEWEDIKEKVKLKITHIGKVSAVEI